MPPSTPPRMYPMGLSFDFDAEALLGGGWGKKGFIDAVASASGHGGFTHGDARLIIAKPGATIGSTAAPDVEYEAADAANDASSAGECEEETAVGGKPIVGTAGFSPPWAGGVAMA